MFVDAGDVVERAAILEYDCGLTRSAAEAQALAEAYDHALTQSLPGVLGELVAADRVRRSIADCAEGFGCRWPWGFAHVVPDGDHYRPANPGERATAAFVVPAVEHGVLTDLAAQSFALKGIRTRLGAADLLGADDVAAARETGLPLYVFANIACWLAGGSRGAVILDWRRVSTSLDGVSIILCDAASAARLQAATRACHPRPLVAVPAHEDNRHAA